MHPARLSFLAVKHQQYRVVVARDARVDGTTLTLECGHTSTIAPHFDASAKTQCGCIECGERYVRTAPRYASEFAAV